MQVQLGNDAPMKATGSDNNLSFQALNETNAVTTVNIPDGVGIQEAFMTLTLPGGVVDNHFHGDAKPTWVWSDSAGLAALIAEQYGCPTREQGV